MKVRLRDKPSPKQHKVHYALRAFQSIRFFGETIWQPICGISDIKKITMTTVLKRITCLHCRNKLVKNMKRLGLGRQINKVRREGGWR